MLQRGVACVTAAAYEGRLQGWDMGPRLTLMARADVCASAPGCAHAGSGIPLLVLLESIFCLDLLIAEFAIGPACPALAGASLRAHGSVPRVRPRRGPQRPRPPPPRP